MQVKTIFILTTSIGLLSACNTKQDSQIASVTSSSVCSESLSIADKSSVPSRGLKIVKGEDGFYSLNPAGVFYIAAGKTKTIKLQACHSQDSKFAIKIKGQLQATPGDSLGFKLKVGGKELQHVLPTASAAAENTAATSDTSSNSATVMLTEPEQSMVRTIPVEGVEVVLNPYQQETQKKRLATIQLSLYNSSAKGIQYTLNSLPMIKVETIVTAATAQKPAEEAAQPVQKPAEEAAQPQQKPAEEAAQPQQKPAEEAAQPQQKPAEEAAQPQQKPAEEATQPQQKPAEEVAQPQQGAAV